MQLKEAIETRSSVRKFTNDPVSVDDLKELVRLAGKAPSVNNAQPWKFIAVTSKDTLKCMSEAVKDRINEMLPTPANDAAANAKSQVEWFSTFFADAPAVLVVLSQPYEAVIDKALEGAGVDHETLNELRGHPDVLSIGATVQTFLLAAVDMGYGACWLSGPVVARESLETCLGVQSPWRIATMIAVGRPAATVSQREKKPIDEIFEIR